MLAFPEPLPGSAKRAPDAYSIRDGKSSNEHQAVCQHGNAVESQHPSSHVLNEEALSVIARRYAVGLGVSTSLAKKKYFWIPKVHIFPPKMRKRCSFSFANIDLRFCRQINSGTKTTNPGVEAWHESGPGALDSLVSHDSSSAVRMVQVNEPRNISRQTERDVVLQANCFRVASGEELAHSDSKALFS